MTPSHSANTAAAAHIAKPNTGKLATSLPAAISGTRAVTTENLNGRSGPGTSYSVILVIPKGATVTHTGSTSGTWVKVTYAGKALWVSSTYLTTVGTKVYRWATANVNVRTGPSTAYRSLGVASAWEKMEYLGKNQNGFSYVSSSRGKGWVSNSYLSTVQNYAVSVYGTLRRGQSAYFLLQNKTVYEAKTRLPNHSLYLRPDKTWWSFVIPSSSSLDSVVAERMDIRKDVYTATLAQLDDWERYDPRQPLDDQNYNRKIVKDQDRKLAYVYVAGKKIGEYLLKNGIKVKGGDYLQRY
ncbi:SH3 domain-containing protein [Neomicrococcus lactis]|uniref:SH3 domain-containing protein n=1 Tax=Neomicrococcus lactis TaxID=732241 RepID=UPI0023012584|nr:SH3 domain-containing protein [Neomicrococcus lactis]